MDDVVRLGFTSALTLEKMEQPLADAGGLEWQSRKSEAGETYLRGLTNNGVKVRILPPALGGRWIAEIHFPIGKGWTRFSDDEKRELVRWISSQILGAIKGSDIREEPPG